jgi:hypothetical protein
MGNVGVATADIATAAFANPAMLAFQRKDDDFSLLLTVGAYLNDSGGMIDDIDAFQAADSSGDVAEMLAIAQQLNDKVIAPELSGAVAVGFAGETYSMAISARKDFIAVGGISNIASDVIEVVDPNFNILDISGVQTTELGLSLARNFDWMGRKVSIGLTPKLVSVKAISLSESVTTIDTGLGDLIDDPVRDLGEFTTLDVGVVIGITDNIQFGVIVRNLISEDTTFLSADGITLIKIAFDTQIRAGMAYRTGFFTLGADLDLVENESIVSAGTKTQMLSLGAELNAFDFAQLRVGVMKNIASDLPDKAGKPLYAVGAGFWLGFVLDVAVVSGEGDSLGAFVQTGFKF